jgi:hypothetical protein
VISVLAAAVAAGVVAAASWLIFLVLRPLAFAGGQSALVSLVVLIGLFLYWFVSPLIAGIIGGAVSRSPLGVAGSLVGYLAVDGVGASTQGIRSGPTEGFVIWVAMICTLLAAGHFAGVASRPRRRPA